MNLLEDQQGRVNSDSTSVYLELEDTQPYVADRELANA
jgi:hypothetical protein